MPRPTLWKIAGGCAVALLFLTCVADPDSSDGGRGGDAARDVGTTADAGRPRDGGPPGVGPRRHRPSAAVCDRERPRSDPGVPDDWDDPECRTHEECVAGVNGRCVGNGHDGYYCTYDTCFADAECDGMVCECDGGWRSGANVCLGEGNCRVDADCGAGGFCSPTFGDCGDYGGVVGYYCHTAGDDCLDDEDCGRAESWGNYCAFNHAAGKWMCSDSQCVG